jgi:hypothetical protein
VTRRRQLFLAGAALLALAAPFAEGALWPFRAWPLCACAAALAACAFFLGRARAFKLAVVLASVALTLTAADLGLRLTPYAPYRWDEPLPRMPLVRRYRRDFVGERRRSGEMARLSGVKEWAEERTVRVVTDAEGFRNGPRDESRPLDLILLGDSFGAGAVSQEDTWTSILARDYGLNTYNLSMPGSSPWQEYVNLWMEHGRLRTRPGALVVWQLFTGNDLDDQYGPADLNALPWQGPARAWMTVVNDWRVRSPVRNMLVALRTEGYARAQVIPRDFPGGRKVLFYRPYVSAASRTPEQVAAHPNFAALKATVEGVKGLTDRLGLRLLVVLVPTKEEVYGWALEGGPPWSSGTRPAGFSSALARLCAERGVEFLDLKPRFVEESRRAFEESGQIFYWYDDTHLNPAGNRAAVSEIARRLPR